MVLDPTEPDIPDCTFPYEDWSHSVYSGASEQLPSNMLEQGGYGFIVCANVDSDHARSDLTCRSRTDFLIFLHSVLIF